MAVTATGHGGYGTSADVAHVLVEALPYIRRFAGQVIVVKLGGNALAGEGAQEALGLFAQDMLLMQSVGIRVVVVHGGGPQIDRHLARLGMSSEFVDGIRKTDHQTMDVVQMVLTGQVNPTIVSALNVHGPIAVGISGVDGRLIESVEYSDTMGRTGRVARINPKVVFGLMDEGLIPVVASIGADGEGQVHNVNADSVAGEIAGALDAERVIFLTDIKGILRDVDDTSSIISSISTTALRAMIDDGTLTGGMIPKATSCLDAVAAGTKSAHILDGRIPHVTLLELFTDGGVGTMVTP